MHQLQAGAVYAKESAICSQSEEESSSEYSFYLQVNLKCTQADNQKIPRPIHLITNLPYRLKPHHTRNLYLRARLNTCADVNLMPACVYKLVFQDLNMKKLTPNSLEIGTYSTDTVKCYVRQCWLKCNFTLDFFKCLGVLHFISLYGALSLHNPAHLQVHFSLHT